MCVGGGGGGVCVCVCVCVCIAFIAIIITRCQYYQKSFSILGVFSCLRSVIRTCELYFLFKSTVFIFRFEEIVAFSA